MQYKHNRQKVGGTVEGYREDVNRKNEAYTLKYKVKDAKTERRSDSRDDDFRVYPNPASDYFSINEVSHLKEVIVINLVRSEEHTSELQSRGHLVCRLLLENKKRRTA